MYIIQKTSSWKNGGVVVSETETKEYKVILKKRRLMDNFDSLPYAFD